MLSSLQIKGIIKNGGASISYKGEVANLKSGYMVSLPDHERKINAKSFELIKRLVNKMLENAKPGCYIGLWVDNETCYIDVSCRIETKAQAIKLGKKYKQLAIWSNKNGVAYRLD